MTGHADVGVKRGSTSPEHIHFFYFPQDVLSIKYKYFNVKTNR
jgi:hypothetical protein